jgi:hypothetical protein
MIEPYMYNVIGWSITKFEYFYLDLDSKMATTTRLSMIKHTV